MINELNNVFLSSKDMSSALKLGAELEEMEQKVSAAVDRACNILAKTGSLLSTASSSARRRKAQEKLRSFLGVSDESQHRMIVPETSVS